MDSSDDSRLLENQKGKRSNGGHQTALSVSSHHAQVLLRGIPLGYIDRTGHLSVWNASKLITETISIMNQRGFYHNKDVGNETRRLFLGRQKLVFSPRLHSDISKIMDTNILVNATPGKVGKSSKTMNMKITDESGVMLIKGTFTAILFDTETKRAVPFPKWYVEKFNSTLSYDDNGHIQAKNDVPSYAYKTQLKVRHSDMDSNMHVSNTEYLRYCMETATDASLSGYYNKYRRDMCWYPLLELDISYLAESRAGEMLDIYTWQDQNDIHFIYFAIHRDGTAIAVAAFEFGFDEVTSSNL
ncbi:uncharacterized protein LOC117322391 [Pecten maximus]|uniref:uncharacterized protein LOC117322391 n=1 Tax=Pecten maximus TaxID=6579 RepID=UPI0014583A85|nr:uncharacterized protein LOC117322391 [Pecten maximus]